MFGNKKGKSAELKDEMMQKAAEGAARGAEKLADSTQNTADAVRAWADKVDRANRSSAWTFIGWGLLIALVAVVGYLLTSKGEKHRERFEEITKDARDKIAG